MKVFTSPDVIISPPAQTRNGQIQLILGPMFSGKSTELIRRLKRYEVAQYKVLIVKYAKDTRYDETRIATHDRQLMAAVSATALGHLDDAALDDADVIGVDEAQFFPDVLDFAEKMSNCGKIVLLAALDGTYQRKPFPNILELVALAENVIKLSAVCMNCFGEAAFTKRTSADEEIEVIGGADKYMAVCRKCYFAPVKVAASPRPLLKTAAVVRPAEENGGEGASLPKKMLFANGDSGTLTTASAV